MIFNPFDFFVDYNFFLLPFLGFAVFATMSLIKKVVF